MRLNKIILLCQTIYYLVTALWALAEIDSFMKVTGPKTDIWLVKTVAVLLLAISCSFIAAFVTNNFSTPVLTLAVGCCVVLIVIDYYYVAKGTISGIYLLDALAEFCLLIAWIIMLVKRNTINDDRLY